MSVTTIERETFGDQLAPIERLVCGLIVAAGAVGHVALAAAVGAFLYTVLTVAL